MFSLMQTLNNEELTGDQCLRFHLFLVKLLQEDTYTHVCAYMNAGTRNRHLWVTCAARGASLARSTALNGRWRAPALMLMILRLSEASFFVLCFPSASDKKQHSKFSRAAEVPCETAIRQDDCAEHRGSNEIVLGRKLERAGFNS